jgi:soluble lytic murein transglycosylase-like protein
MKRVIVGILLGVVILSHPIQVKANALSYIPSQEVDGIPTEITQYAEIIGNEFNICPELLEAIAFYESSYDPEVTNGNCKGLMQVNPTVHKLRFEEAGWSTSDWDNAYINMYIAADYLSELFEKYEDAGIVLGIYHGESDAIEKGKSGRLSSYTKKILKRSEELERAHGK